MSSFKFERSRIILTSLITLLLASAATSADKPPQPAPAGDIPEKFVIPDAQNDYIKRTEIIPMRDGVKLNTVIVMPKGTKNAPKLAIEVLKSGQHLANIQAQLPPPDAAGLIQFASALPLDSFQPGSYELKITVSDGAANIARSLAFTVAP